jgi:hypothetical protein
MVPNNQHIFNLNVMSRWRRICITEHILQYIHRKTSEQPGSENLNSTAYNAKDKEATALNSRPLERNRDSLAGRRHALLRAARWNGCSVESRGARVGEEAC